MMERYVKTSSLYGILHRLSIEAADIWDMDGTIMCGRIRKELDKLPEGDYVELPTATEDHVRHV